MGRVILSRKARRMINDCSCLAGAHEAIALEGARVVHGKHGSYRISKSPSTIREIQDLLKEGKEVGDE